MATRVFTQASTTEVDSRAVFRVALPIVFFVVLVNFITMPTEEYFGDASAVRVQAVNFLNTHRWEVPARIATRIGERGQYFYENARGDWFNYYWLPRPISK